MKFVSINSKTRVLQSPGVDIPVNQLLSEFDPRVNKLHKNFLKERKNRNPQEQLTLYKRFVRDVFHDRSFISKQEFNRLIVEKFNSNSTFYRKRMIENQLIIEKNNLIKTLNSTKL